MNLAYLVIIFILILSSHLYIKISSGFFHKFSDEQFLFALFRLLECETYIWTELDASTEDVASIFSIILLATSSAVYLALFFGPEEERDILLRSVQFNANYTMLDSIKPHYTLLPLF
jgi:hypothetical protein